MEDKMEQTNAKHQRKSLGGTPNKEKGHVKAKDRRHSSGPGMQGRRKALSSAKKQKWAKQTQQKMTFKLGGNNIDPLNLMGLGKDGACSPRVDSPLCDRGSKFEPGDIRPVDVTDPLKLNNLDDDVLNVKAHAHKKRKKRKRRHTLTENDNDMDVDKSVGEDPSCLVKGTNESLKDNDQISDEVEGKSALPMNGNFNASDKVDKSEFVVKSEDKIETLPECKDIPPENKTKSELSEVEINKHAEQKKKHAKSDKANKKKSLPEPVDKAPQKTSNFREKNNKYKYGNYNRYYGYRNANMTEDDRIEYFQREWFEGKSCLDIGCNVGHLTLYIARHHHPLSLLGVDIDETLIRSARNNIRNYLPTKKAHAPLQSEFPISFAICHGPLAAPVLPTEKEKSFGFPYNISFRTENYVECELDDLKNVKQEYDFILCLSVTKWIQLNWGDDGIKKMFQKMFRHLKPDGRLLLEPQPWKSYNKKKNMTPSIRAMYDTLQFKPDQFIPYLLSEEVGFAKSEMLGVPKHKAQGFQRPIYLLTKGSCGGSEPKLD